ncbi:MAG TPA: FAD-dependent oxidoreductase, partial [Actinomycetota bacterium]|nr:FAD-dependent oxidoreductase [Actinomycetota bacterium]
PLPSSGVAVTDRARVVVIGGGVTGCSVALHLARAGWTDLVLFDKGELTSGSTAHAAGLVTMFNPSPTMTAFRRYSIELYGELGVFDAVGSLRIASSPESLEDLRRGVSRARAIGLDVELLSPEETLRRMPAASAESLFGGVWVPADGFLDPHTATYALADAARALGVRIRTNERVTGIELDASKAVRAVRTEHGRVECEVVVDAGGIWAPRVAAMAGVRIPSTPVDHQHVALKAVPGSELPRDMPCFRDPDHLVYGKSEAGGILFGGYEPDPVARWIDGAPWEHGGRSLPPDLARFEELLRHAARRFPFLADAEIVRLVCHPDAMTPDANPLVGPAPTAPGLWFAAGLSLNGFGAAGGLGRALAGWIVEGDPGLDLTAYRPWRFGRVHEDAGWVAELARETYRYYYRLRYPFDHDEWGRPKRLSPVHGRLQEAGAVFQAKHGWERPERFEPGRPWRRAGADQRAFGWTRPPWLDRIGQEHRAVRERAGIFDLSSFGKIDVTGPGALGLLDRAAANRVDVGSGRVVYTQLLDERGGIVADVTVTRLAEERFRVITGAAAVDGDLGWLRHLATRHAIADVDLRDASEDLAVIAVWGRAAPGVLEAASGVDPAGVAPMTGREVRVGPVAAWAQAVSFAGEPGWELTVRPEDAVQVWDRLADAGRAVDLEPCGYRCLDGLRIEKGLRYLGSDLTADDTPLEAGLERFVAFEGRDFVGRAALLGRREAGIDRRLRTLLVGEGSGYVRLYGGEAVLRDGRTAGRVRSAAYAFTLERNVALAYLPVDLGLGDDVAVEVFGEVVPAVVADDVLVTATSPA